MTKLGILALALLILGCTATKNSILKAPDLPQVVEAKLDKQEQQREALKQFVADRSLSPGKASLVWFPYFGPFKEEALFCNNHAIPFFHEGHDEKAFAFIGLSYFSTEKEMDCQFSFGDGEQVHTEAIRGLHIVAISYPEEQLRVADNKVVLSTKDLRRAKHEAHLLEQAYLKGASEKLFSTPFDPPLLSKVTSSFGKRRVFNSVKRGEHLGIDFRAQTGTPIKAANSGRVLITGDFFFHGGMVVVDHGAGIFTAYLHLSKILVGSGDHVDKDTVVGLSGKTGRVNAPHLHWGVKVNGNWIDGASLIEASQEVFSRR